MWRKEPWLRENAVVFQGYPAGPSGESFNLSEPYFCICKEGPVTGGNELRECKGKHLEKRLANRLPRGHIKWESDSKQS